MKVYNVANGDESAYYSAGYSTQYEAAELLKIAKTHDPEAHLVEYEAKTELELLKDQLVAVKRERDQAVADLHALALKKGSCYACIHRPKEGRCEYFGRCTAVISDSDFWEWRGVREDAHAAD